MFLKKNTVYDAIRKKEKYIAIQSKEMEDIIHSRDMYRDEIAKFALDMGKLPSSKSVDKTVAGVDSAFSISRRILSNFYVSLPVAVKISSLGSSRYDYTYAEYDIYYLDTVISSISLSTELIMAKELLNECDYVFMDGSVSTFLITMISGIETARKHSQESIVSKYALEIYEISKNFICDVIESGRVIFVPKMSQKRLLAGALSAFEKYQISDYILLRYLLDKGEYIKLKSPEYGKFIMDDIASFLNDAVNNNLSVYYVKGSDGYVFKFETFGELPKDIVRNFAFGKEFYLTLRADREAKELISIILHQENIYDEEVRL